MLTNSLKFIASIAICELTGIAGGFFTASLVSTWYSILNKPSFSPPNWVFGPVWTILYFLMGVSLFLVWKRGFETKKSRIALYIFFGQLALNFLWSILFFGLHSPHLALVDIIVLWIVILLTILKFMTISKVAAYLLIPYLLWVSFAAVLNFNIWKLN